MVNLFDPWTGKKVPDDGIASPLAGDGANGDYVIRRENGKTSYVPLSIPPQELPEYPETDGSYVLTLTVASGEGTLSWESAE